MPANQQHHGYDGAWWKIQDHDREQLDIQGKLKPIERRLGTLKKHIEQADIYFKHKGKKPLAEAGKIRKSIYSILRQEQREQQPCRKQDMER